MSARDARHSPELFDRPEYGHMTRPRHFALCQVACVDGTWAYRVVSRHTTSRAALNAAAFPAAFRGGLWRVRDLRTGRWVEELDGRPAGAAMVPEGAELVEVRG